MLEYASIRLIFRCGIAKRFPTVCVTIAITAIAAIQSTWMASRPTRKTLNRGTMTTFFEPPATNVELVVGERCHRYRSLTAIGETATMELQPARCQPIGRLLRASQECL